MSRLNTVILRALFLLTMLQPAAEVSFAQQYPIRRYDMNDGLSHSNVYRIFQDRRGFIWFCTDYGLCSFDGKSFHGYSNDSLLNRTVLSITEDSAGNRIASTFSKGIVLITDSSTSRYPITNRPSAMQSLYSIVDGSILWTIAQDSGQHLFKITGGKIVHVPVKDSLNRLVFFHSVLKYKNEIIFATTNGLYKVESGNIVPFLHDVVRGDIRYIAHKNDGTYWVATGNTIQSIIEKRVASSFKVPEGQLISGIFCDDHGKIWVPLYGEGMLLIYNGQCHDISSRLGINSIVVNDIMEDKEGNIWLATYGAGAFKVGSRDILNYSLAEHKMNTYCNALEPIDKSRLLVGTIGKIGIWNNGNITQLPFKQLKHDDYVYFVKYIDGVVYVGVPGGLLMKKVNSMEPDKFVPNTVAGAISFCAGDEKDFWLGGYRSIAYVKNNVAFDTFLNSPLRGKRINAILRDHNDNLWFGTSVGIYKFDGKNFGSFLFPQNRSLQIIHSLFEDSHGRVWAATEGGLVCIDKAGKYIVYTKEHGLNDNKCNKITEDGQNTLWVGTVHGINFVDLNTLAIKGYGPGVYPNEVLSLYCGDSNMLFVGTANGLASIKTDRIAFDDTPPPLFITSVKTPRGVINMPASISLQYNEPTISISFIGVNMQEANTVEYRYKIQGLDDNWHVTTNNTIEIRSMPPGNYTFLLNARRNGGGWGADVSMTVFIPTPFWKTWWFSILLFSGFAVIIFVAAQKRTRLREEKKRQRLSLQNKVAYLKQQALSALINPHFIFNCMNSIQYYLSQNDNDRANEYLADFARLIRLTMENAQDVLIPLQREIERIELYLSLEQLRFGDTLTYSIEIESSLNDGEIKIPNMILQPYVENAIWHGIMPQNGVGVVRLNFRRQGQDLHIVIEDNGIGIENSKKLNKQEFRSHYGMKLTQTRLELLQQLSGQNYKVSVKQMILKPANAGTRVDIVIPIKPLESALANVIDE